ncbi:unnamed protein product [Spirodela intermedia]|uniref:Uncharacterized protein n=1 Tax=Spirodela intermedia TaxID=51605 RepID=A0A7I8JIE4_SPIIN|nr:unnamed protein product [Spirodela intermedia]CAA6669916.1 unnamed protein product [Spirodela intermedia]
MVFCKIDKYIKPSVKTLSLISSGMVVTTSRHTQSLGGRVKHAGSGALVSCLRCEAFHSRRATVARTLKPRASALVCASAALNARCAAEQTQTVTRQSSTITIAPIQGKEKSPELDDGGSGFPPRDDDDGGGGGGGGGPGWSGGFFFFGFLAFLGFLQDKEREGDYRDRRKDTVIKSAHLLLIYTYSMQAAVASIYPSSWICYGSRWLFRPRESVITLIHSLTSVGYIYIHM